jgi:hypothetical protein
MAPGLDPAPEGLTVGPLRGGRKAAKTPVLILRLKPQLAPHRFAAHFERVCPERT